MIRTSTRRTEWFLTVGLMILLTALFISAKLQTSILGDAVELRPVALLQIEIKGEVAKPGNYQVAAGTSLGECLKKAKPLQTANLRNTDIETPLLESQKINVSPLSAIQIYLIRAHGIRENIELPIGSRICDLKKYISIEEIDPKFLKSRKLLKDQEVIALPMKTDS